jgi:hypothetical protein
MSNTVVEGLFLLACWLPPMTVFACALLLLVKAPPARQSSAPSHSTLATR